MYRVPQPADIRDAYDQLREIRAERILAEDDGRTEDVMHLNEREEEIQRQLDQLRAGSAEQEKSVSVTAEDIAEVLSMWTGIPIYQFTQEESARLLEMESDSAQEHCGTG
jgi:ATP-dependent Clp protease ATP-binding subunit ClpC